MRQLILTLITILLLTSFSENLFACSCKPEKTVEEEIKYSDAIVVGTVISKQIEKFYKDTTDYYKTAARYDILVQDIYKGVIIYDTLTIYTGLDLADCGVPFDVGKKYIVYGRFDYSFSVNFFWTSSCMRTKEYLQDEIVQIEKFTKRLGDK